ncbi:MAG: hypothetical protein LAT55_04355 [Opitutales bacterium]|nr:hypothetical protein [Opitutales bacterium]
MKKQIFIYLPNRQEASLLAHLLFDFGYLPTFFSKKDDALAELAESRSLFTLIVLPYEENEENPFGLIEKIRKEHPFTPIYMIGPKLKLDSITHAIRLGVRDIFTPPLSWEEIVASVDALARGKKRNKKHTETITARVKELIGSFNPAPTPLATDNDKPEGSAEVEELQKKVKELEDQVESLSQSGVDSAEVSEEVLNFNPAEIAPAESMADDMAALLKAYQELAEIAGKQQAEIRQVIAAAKAKEKDLEEAQMLMTERDAYLEECENTMMEKTQSLHEKEVELEQMKDEIFQEKARLAKAAAEGSGGTEALGELEKFKTELEEERKSLAEQKKKFEEDKRQWEKERKASKNQPSASTPQESSPESEDAEGEKGEASWKQMQKRSKLIRSW